MHQSSTILDHPLVSSRYFFPRCEAFPQPYWVDAVDGSRLACAYHVVNPAAKTVIYFHGNGEVVADEHLSHEYGKRREQDGPSA